MRRLWQRSGFFGSWAEAAWSGDTRRQKYGQYSLLALRVGFEAEQRQKIWNCVRVLEVHSAVVVNYWGAVLVVRVGRERVRNR